MNIIQKTIIATIISTELFSQVVEIKHNTFKVDNIIVKVLDHIKLSKEEKEFPLEIVGDNVSRKYLIKNEKELKIAIKDMVKYNFNNVEIECVYRNKCMINKDYNFLNELYNIGENFDNNITLITPKYTIDFTTQEFLKSPEILIRDFEKKDIDLINNKILNRKTINIYKNQWDLMETQRDKKILTNMFVKKMYFYDYNLYKEVINNENIPKFMSSLIGSEYCNIEIKNLKLITNLKCDIPLYEDKNKNALFVNGFYYVGLIDNKKISKNKIIYTLVDTENIENKMFNFNYDFSQKNLNYFPNLINVRMKNKDQFTKYFINENENKLFKKKRFNSLKNIIKKYNIKNKKELYDILMKLKKEEDLIEYRNN